MASKLKFPIPILLLKKFTWNTGLKILGITDIVLSFLAFILYLLLHTVHLYDLSFLPLSYLAIFNTGMAFIEISLLLYAGTAGFCLFISLKKRDFPLKLCMVIEILEAVGVCIHITGVMMISFGCITLDVWQLPFVKQTLALTISNAVLTFITLFTYKAYWCYLVLYIHAVSVNPNILRVNVNERRHIRLSTLPSKTNTAVTEDPDDGHHHHHHKNHNYDDDDQEDTDSHHHKHHKKHHHRDVEESSSVTIELDEGEPKPKKHKHHTEEESQQQAQIMEEISELEAPTKGGHSHRHHKHDEESEKSGRHKSEGRRKSEVKRKKRH